MSMNSGKKAPLSAQDPIPQEPIVGSRVGWVVGVDPGRGVLVDYEGNTAGPLPALSTVPLDAKSLEQAVASRQRAVLLFENGSPTRPLLVGLVQTTSSTPLIDELLEARVPREQVEARVDGKRVVIEGQDEIVLSCGKASITLRRNGKVIIKGVQLESSAAGVNRIKGGSVQIN
ncbi:DUF6484 domain-containing protein [Archangium violaceum]|uniref:DUF6484 domain-containing protein n=1 Tax=Archangium violaceum Cb vi76 TaxID=1406225 RepID=A0A084SQ21_9BACT|nr:DUF6484 domain-containing protein [Archangium violaceum]KFA90556.1 hypothetical protein Q664_27765 [Archangium violaceum Cb vi76]